MIGTGSNSSAGSDAGHRRHDVPLVDSGPARQPLRVLLVEDNPDDAELIVRLLRRGGYEPEYLRVQTAEALDQALAQGQWDIVLSDYAMPQFDGLRALRALREQSAFLPFIIISGSIGEETAVAAMRAGASDYLMKSNLTRLVPAIERELRESADRRERARTKKALLELQEKFQAVFREYLDVMLVLDVANGDILHVNQAVTHTMGYDERWLAGQGFETFWPTDQRAAAKAVLARVRAEGSAFYSGWFLRLDGSECPMDLQASLVSWGRTEAVIVTLRDVTERHLAQQRLSEEKEQLATTLRSIGEAVATTDERGCIALLNGVAEELTGWTQHEAAGRRLAEVFQLRAGSGGAPCHEAVVGVLRSGGVVELNKNVTLRSRDGRECALSLTAAPIRRQEDGLISGLVMVFRDITSEQKLEEELQKASKLESVALVAGGIAHDFNNILTAILGHISLAKAGMSPVPPVIGAIEKACLYATDLTRQLLTFSKGSTPNRQVESLREVVREGVEFSLHGSSLRCSFDLPDDLAAVEVDRSQIHQVLNNLVINAIQASSEGGRLHVDARNTVVSREHPVAALEPGRYVRLTVRDNGTGIAPEHLARIFEPYFTTKSAGSGLGLATAYSIIKKHDGSMRAESEIGVGTSFHIYLPAASVVPPAPVGKVSDEVDGHMHAPVAGPTARVLFMDDEVILQELVSAMLEYLGYEAVCAASGEEALERFQEARNSGRPAGPGGLGPPAGPGGLGRPRDGAAVARARSAGAGHRVQRLFQRPDPDQFSQSRFHGRHRQALPDGGVGQGSGRSDRAAVGPLKGEDAPMVARRVDQFMISRA